MANYFEAVNLGKTYKTPSGDAVIVKGFELEMEKGEFVCVLGHSGCGKSTVALGVMQDLGVNGRIVGGSIKFKGRDLGEMSDEELRDIRGSEIAMIYQEPMASLGRWGRAWGGPF